MQTRRLIVTPLVVLASALFIGAVIESGQQAREHAIPTRPSVMKDARIHAEIDRVTAAMQVESACIGANECSAARRAARVRSEAAAIRRWPADQRFEQERQALRDLLELRAAVIMQEAAMDLDGIRSSRERTRLDELLARQHHAARSALDARHAVGLLDDAAYRAALTDWRADAVADR